MTSWTATFPLIQTEVVNEEEALADNAKRMLRGATCLKSTVVLATELAWDC